MELIYKYPGGFYLPPKLDKIISEIQKTHHNIWMDRIFTFHTDFTHKTERYISFTRTVRQAKKLFEMLPTAKLKLEMWDHLTRPECNIEMSRVFAEQVAKDVVELIEIPEP